MPVICPTLTAADAQEYTEQYEKIKPFAERIHLDFMDGEFALRKSIDIAECPRPENVRLDVHVMYQNPAYKLPDILRLNPYLVIVHAEASGNFISFAEELHKSGVKAGVALLPKTPLKTIYSGLDYIDHILIFSGDLGYFGGHADLTMLGKVSEAKHLKPGVEIGWDGGINDENVASLIDSGVDVLNVGGFIHNSDDPSAAYAKLKDIISKQI